MPGASRGDGVDGGATRAWCAACKTMVRAPLRAHEMKCPVLVRAAQARARAYYSKDINVDVDVVAGAGGEGARDDGARDEGVREAKARAAAAALTAASRSRDSHGGDLLVDVPANESLGVVARECAQNAAERRAREKELSAPTQSRHDAQFAGIVSAMRLYGLVRSGADVRASDKPLYVEFGAGRGYLSHFLSDAYGDVDLALVERRAYRHKAERSLRRRTGFIERLTIDIKDLNLNAVDAVASRDLVAMAKHLCGEATDLALRACFGRGSTARTNFRVRGVAFATCCHHRCAWNTYVNREYLISLGIGRDEFEYLTKISSWATLATNADAETAGEHASGAVHFDASHAFDDVTDEEKLKLGRLAKRILDEGRARWCQSQGLSATLEAFVPRTTSPENVILLARDDAVGERVGVP